MRENLRVLVVGAGGLGCELLKDLALSGFKQIDVIDMDTIDVSNLNRQFLFRPADVGQPKAHVAARRIMERVEGVTVTPHVGRLEDQGVDWYTPFHLIALGLDSVEARRALNAIVCGLLSFDADGNVDPSTLKPMVDGGSEGFRGHARVILPGHTACFECTLYLFPPQTTYPLCTLAETPRSPAHCIEYARLVLWDSEMAPTKGPIDVDNPEHMAWLYQKASARADSYGISGVTLQLTQGVAKNIIPAVASTNAIVAAQCALEVFKAATMISKGLDNFMVYSGGEGVYTSTNRLAPDPSCPICAPGTVVRVARNVTVREALAAVVAGGVGVAEGVRSGDELSLSVSGRPVLLRGGLEGMYADRLEQTLVEFLPEDVREMKEITGHVHAPALVASRRVRFRFDA